MAKVSTTENVKAKKAVEEPEEIMEVEVEEAPKDEKVMIHLIPAEWDNAEFYVFGINGNVCQINTGVDVEVSKDLAENIANVKRDMLEARARQSAREKGIKR